MYEPAAIEPTMSRPSTVSVRSTLSASEKPSLVTVKVNVWLAPPAVTVALLNSFVTLNSTFSMTVVSTVFEPLLPRVGSIVPVEATEAVLDRTTPLSTVLARLTCTVKTSFAPAARPVVLVQVTTWAGGRAAGAARWKVRPVVERVGDLEAARVVRRAVVVTVSV